MSELTLTYFNIQGPAEPARLALKVGKIPFTDKRVDFKDWSSNKDKWKEDGKLPFGQLPTFQVDGTLLAQSAAIANYCAKIAGLVPEDIMQQYKIDEAVAFISQDIRDRTIAPTMKLKGTF